jgi:protein SCO1/2/putative membrane protein
MPEYISYLPHLNACLNGTSAVLLFAGFSFIRFRQSSRAPSLSDIRACCFRTFSCFLSYLSLLPRCDQIPGTGLARPIYFTILTTHTILAIVIVPLIAVTFFRALKLDFVRHRKIARITLPLWLYVSITGVIVYLMLYRIYPS